MYSNESILKECGKTPMKTVIKNVRVLGELTDIAVSDGKILSVGKLDESGIDMQGLKAYPGLIDVHSHGAVGVDTMDGNLHEVAKYELAHGVTTYYPTTLTVSEEDIIAATEQKTDFPDGANIPGFHIEGPFINVKRKGAQNEKFIVPPSIDVYKKYKNAKLITLAPEVEGAIDFIRECDAVVCIGHSDADYETAAEAFSAGAQCITHTFNAMSGLHHRDPSIIGAGADCGAYAQIISDGFHLHPSVVRLAVKMFGKDKVVLISDSMLGTSAQDGEYIFGGLPTTVTDGRAYTDYGAIAGSTTNLFDCVRCAISFGIPEEDAVKMASENPARLMKLNKGVIASGYDADIIFVDDDFNLRKVMVRGQMQ